MKQKSSGNYYYILYIVEENITYMNVQHNMNESGEFPRLTVRKLEQLLKLKVGRV